MLILKSHNLPQMTINMSYIEDVLDFLESADSDGYSEAIFQKKGWSKFPGESSWQEGTKVRRLQIKVQKWAKIHEGFFKLIDFKKLEESGMDLDDMTKYAWNLWLHLPDSSPY